MGLDLNLDGDHIIVRFTREEFRHMTAAVNFCGDMDVKTLECCVEARNRAKAPKDRKGMKCQATIE